MWIITKQYTLMEFAAGGSLHFHFYSFKVSDVLSIVRQFFSPIQCFLPQLLNTYFSQWYHYLIHCSFTTLLIISFSSFWYFVVKQPLVSFSLFIFGSTILYIHTFLCFCFLLYPSSRDSLLAYTTVILMSTKNVSN